MARLTHIAGDGSAKMVDVSAKPLSRREAVARGQIRLQPATLELIASDRIAKGSVFATARIAGIQAAKQTGQLIPLCHPLAITKATLDFELSKSPTGIRVIAEVKVAGPTGVEMEALTGVSVACLTLYDMLKAADKAMTIEDIRLVEKTGGKSGTFKAPARPKGR